MRLSTSSFKFTARGPAMGKRALVHSKPARTFLVLAMMLGVLSFVGMADAVHGTAAFELEGDAVNGVAAGDDWDNVCHEVTITNDPGNVVPDQCAGAGDTAGATATSWANDGPLNASIFTGGGSKDFIDVNQWAWKDEAGGLPDKSNLLHSFAARYSLPKNATTCPAPAASTTCEVLYFGSDRYDNSGDAQQGFWFFKNEIGFGTNSVGGGTGFTGTHANGDLLVISDFSNGGTVSTITVYKWDSTCKKTAGTCAEANLRQLATSTTAKCHPGLVNTDGFCGVVNPADGAVAPWTTFTDKSGSSSYLNGELFEGGINLSQLGLADQCFSSVLSETRTSTSPTAVLKDFVLGGFGSCDTTLVTTPKTGATPPGTIPSAGLSIGTGSVTAKDTAVLTVSGVSTWSGDMDFYLCGPIATGTCTTGGKKIGPAIAVTNATPQPIPSAAANITSVGRYCWRGVFTSGTNGVPNAEDSSSGECFTVVPVTPTLDTLAVATPVAFGQPVQDNATLSGTATQPGTNGAETAYPTIDATNGAPAGGKITFTLLKSDCTALATGTGTNPQDVTVSGNGTYGPVSFTPDAPGTYHWKAQYHPATGDPNNVGSTHNAACDDPDESVVVNAAPTAMTTRQFVFPQDKTVITAPAGGNLTGSVIFKLYEAATAGNPADANCQANGDTVGAGGLLYKEGPLAVSGASPQSVTTNNTTVRVPSDATLFWRVTYTSTNANQLGSSSICLESTALTYSGNDSNIAIP
ncbi:MAG TPA: hypothetical protein VNA57_05520 [Acidimicrobiales bacterium]|nr:hypothetical protein [Acidimicrobiales bacterium]